MEADETEIINRIIGGEREIFRHLVRTYDGMVFSLAFEVCSDEDIARDITQEAFISAYNHLADYDAKKSRFSTWLYAIAYNIAKMHLRRQRRQPLTLPKDDEIVANINDDVVDEFFKDVADSQEEKLTRLAEAVDKLQPDDRLILTFFYRDNLSLAEIAKVMGAKTGTIATRMSRIRKRLYNYMQK